MKYEKIEKVIEALAEKADTESSVEALQYSQAALNLANTIATTENTKLIQNTPGWPYGNN